MSNPKLWWVVKNLDESISYVCDTYENMSKNVETCKIYLYAIIHPENKSHPEEYRKENNNFSDFIEEQHKEEIKRAKELGAPEYIFKHPESLGVFGINSSDMLKK